MNNLGLFYFDAGNDLLAENYFRNALEMTELSVGANHPDIFWRLHNLFKVAMVRQDLTQAEHLLRRARAVADQQAAATHAEMKALVEEDTHLLRAQVKSATEPHHA